MEKEYFKSSFSIKENINYLCASIVAILPTILIDIFLQKSIWMWSFMLLVYSLFYLLTLGVLKDELYLLILNNIIKQK